MTDLDQALLRSITRAGPLQFTDLARRVEVRVAAESASPNNPHAAIRASLISMSQRGIIKFRPNPEGWIKA